MVSAWLDAQEKEKLCAIFTQIEQTSPTALPMRRLLLNQLLLEIEQLRMIRFGNGKVSLDRTTVLENSNELSSLEDETTVSLLKILESEPLEGESWIMHMRNLRRYLLNEEKIGIPLSMGTYIEGFSDGMDYRVGFSRHKGWDQNPPELLLHNMNHLYGENLRAKRTAEQQDPFKDKGIYRTGNVHGTGSCEGPFGPPGVTETHIPKSGILQKDF